MFKSCSYKYPTIPSTLSGLNALENWNSLTSWFIEKCFLKNGDFRAKTRRWASTLQLHDSEAIVISQSSPFCLRLFSFVVNSEPKVASWKHTLFWLVFCFIKLFFFDGLMVSVFSDVIFFFATFSSKKKKSTSHGSFAIVYTDRRFSQYVELSVNNQVLSWIGRKVVSKKSIIYWSIVLITESFLHHCYCYFVGVKLVNGFWFAFQWLLNKENFLLQNWR